MDELVEVFEAFPVGGGAGWIVIGGNFAYVDEMDSM